MVLVVSVVLIGTALAEGGEFEYLEESEIQGSLYTSETSITGVGLTSVYCNSNSLNESGGRVLSLKVLRSGSGAYSHNSSELNQNSIKLDEEEGYTSSNWKMEMIESTRAAQAETNLNIPGSFKSKPISLLWKDTALTANYPGMTFMNTTFDFAKAFDKDLTIKMYSDVEDIDEYNTDEYDEATDLGIGNSFDLKASFNGMGHLGMRFNNSIIMDEDYRGYFTVSKKLTADSRKKVDNGDYDVDSKDYPWLPCCTGGYFDMSFFDRRYINRGIFT